MNKIINNKIALIGLFMATSLSNNVVVKAQGITPQAQLIVPGKTVFTGTDVLLKAEVPESNATIVKAEFYDSNTRLGEDLSFPFTFEVKKVAAGQHQWWVKVTDNQGNYSVDSAFAESLPLRVNDNPVSIQQGLTYQYFEIAPGDSYPDAGSLALASGATGALDLTVKKRTANFSISYSGYINVPENDFYTFHLHAGDEGRVYIGEELVAEKGNTALEVKKTGLKAGMHAIRVEYLQREGGGRLSLSYTRPAYPEKEVSPLDFFHSGTSKVPAVKLNGPSNTAAFTADVPTVPPTTRIIYFETIADSANIVKVDFYADETLVGTDSIYDAKNKFEFYWKNVPVGYYHLSCRIYKNNGEVGYSNINKITVHPGVRPAPTISLVPLSPQVYVASESIKFNVTAADEDGEVVRVAYYLDNERIKETTEGNFSMDWVATEGTHELKAVALDNRGDSTFSTPITFTVHALGNIKPTISITSPNYGQAYFYPQSATFEVAAHDEDGAVTKIEYYANDSLVQTRYAPSPFQWTWVDPAIQSYKMVAVAYDNDGESTVSDYIYIYVNSKPNPTAEFKSPADNATFQAGANIVLDIDANELDGGTQLVEFYANDRYIGQSTDPSFTFIWNNVASGIYHLKGYAYDMKGVVTFSAPITIVVKTPAQTGDIFGPSCALKNQTIQLELNPVHRNQVKNYRWWTNTSSAKISGTPAWSVNTGANFTSGQFCVDVDYISGAFRQFCKQISLCPPTREGSDGQETASTGALQLWPNPSSEVFNLILQKDASLISVMDQKGVLVYSAIKMEAGSTIQLGNLFPEGLYNVVVWFEDDTKEVMKVVKN